MMPPADNEREFDDLIKAAAENYDASGAAPDWEHMSGLLDKEMPVKKDPRRRLLILLMLAFVLFGGAAYLYSTKINGRPAGPAVATSISPTQVSQPAPVPAPTAKPAVAPAAVPSTAGHTDQEQPILSSQNTSSQQAPKEPGGYKNTKPQNNARGKMKIIIQNGSAGEDDAPGNNKIAGNYKTAVNTNKPGRMASLKQKSGGVAYNPPAQKTNAGLTATSGKKPSGANSNTAGTKEDNSTGNDKNALPVPNDTTFTRISSPDSAGINQPPSAPAVVSVASSGTNKTPVDTKHSGSDKKDKTTGKRKNSLEFSVLYAPELTTIGFSHIDKPGSNYGLLAGYHILNNLTIQTGIIKSRKNYTANGSDFTLRRPLPANNKLYTVEGWCSMYEIPLNVKSQILKRKNFNVFYLAGVSSYIMKNEFYTYYYYTPNGDSARSAKFNTQNNYWFSLATLALGLEKHLTNNLNFEVAPFLKIPFRGMGRGNLKLLSTGINFSLTYRPFLSRK